MLETFTEGYFRVGGYGFGRIDTLDIITPLNQFIARYVTFTVRVWETADFSGEGARLTVDGVSQWHLKLSTAINNFPHIRGLAVDTTLAAVIGKKTLADQSRLQWRLLPEHDKTLKRQVRLADGVFAGVSLTRIAHRESWEAQALNQPYRQLNAGVTYTLSIDAVIREGKAQLPPSTPTSTYTLPRNFLDTKTLREQVLNHARGQCQMALKLPVT